jgi:hypothetical protein
LIFTTISYKYTGDDFQVVQYMYRVRLKQTLQKLLPALLYRVGYQIICKPCNYRIKKKQTKKQKQNKTKKTPRISVKSMDAPRVASNHSIMNDMHNNHWIHMQNILWVPLTFMHNYLAWKASPIILFLYYMINSLNNVHVIVIIVHVLIDLYKWLWVIPWGV